MSRRWPSASRYTIEEALKAILDEDLGLSEGGSIDEEGRGYVGESVLKHADVNVVGDSIVGGPVDRDDQRLA